MGTLFILSAVLGLLVLIVVLQVGFISYWLGTKTRDL